MRGTLFVAASMLVAAAVWLLPQGMPALQAQEESPRLAILEIDVWPEFDRRGTALVILRAELADEVALPATVALSIPASSGGPCAVASAASETGPLINLDYELTSGGEILLLTLTTRDPVFQVEFYDPLDVDASDRSYTYVWPGDLAVGQLSVAVQEPAGATELSTEPELGDGAVGPCGLLYRSAEMGPFEVGKTLTTSVRYVKTDPRTSLEIISPPEAESEGGVPTWLILALAVAALVVVAGAAVYWRWRGRPAAAPAGPGRGEKPASQAFCTQCGAPLRPGRRFCPQCGTAARGE